MIERPAHAYAPSQTPTVNVLAVAAHPDDIEFYAGGTLATWINSGTQVHEFYAGGTLATWINSGTQVHYLIVTDGASGSCDPNCTPAALTQRRRAEQDRAAAILGVAVRASERIRRLS